MLGWTFEKKKINNAWLDSAGPTAPCQHRGAPEIETIKAQTGIDPGWTGSSQCLFQTSSKPFQLTITPIRNGSRRMQSLDRRLYMIHTSHKKTLAEKEEEEDVNRKTRLCLRPTCWRKRHVRFFVCSGIFCIMCIAYIDTLGEAGQDGQIGKILRICSFLLSVSDSLLRRSF